MLARAVALLVLAAFDGLAVDDRFRAVDDFLPGLLLLDLPTLRAFVFIDGVLRAMELLKFRPGRRCRRQAFNKSQTFA